MKPTRALAIWFVVLLAVAACAQTAIGRAVQAADIQKQVVQRAAIEVAKLHAETGKPDAATYAKIRTAYADWVKAEVALAESLAAWKTVKSQGNEQALKLNLKDVKRLVDAYLALVGQFVDLKTVETMVKGGK